MGARLLVLVTGLQGTGKSTMAAAAARALRAPVLGHDWAMSGLRPFREMEQALESLGFAGRRAVGWSILWALAREQLRLGSSVVLDGVARQPEVERTREVAAEEEVDCRVFVTDCADAVLHRSRVEGRRRGIPDWYELDWDHVAQARASWQALSGVDLMLPATDTLEVNAERVRNALGTGQ